MNGLNYPSLLPDTFSATDTALAAFFMRLAIRHLLPGAVHLRLLGFDLGVPSVGFGKVIPIVGHHSRDAHPTERCGFILPTLNRVGLGAVNQRGPVLTPARRENANERRYD
jgi:hypothetical protein